MSARPDTWMPIYWGDYARDTGHLNALAHGAYLMLIKHYWCTGAPLSDNDDELWRIACCDSLKEWRQLRPRIVRLFFAKDGMLRHKRIDRELAIAVAKTEAKAKAGKKGAETRWQNDGNRIADASVCDRQTDTPSPSPSPLPLTTFGDGKPSEPVPVRDALWRDGPPILQSLIGKPKSACRGLLGKLLKTSKDDCARVLGALHEAQKLRPIDPEAWLVKASQPAVERPKAAAWNF